jgi:hypothetical protein
LQVDLALIPTLHLAKAEGEEDWHEAARLDQEAKAADGDQVRD